MAAKNAPAVQHQAMDLAGRDDPCRSRYGVFDGLGVGGDEAVIFGLIIDFICRLLLIGLGVVVVGFILTVIVLMIGEKRKWW